jgi:trehalose 6-phosphate synthase/phosphatase
MLDYDGTLVPFAPTPEEAAPDDELLALLERLARTRGIDVHLLSGRTRFSLERWFGAMNLGLHAEHGLWSRMPGARDWTILHDVPTDWKEQVRAILKQFTDATPGSFIEEKTASIVWHYRNARGDSDGADDFGEHQAKELRLLLGELLSNSPLEVLPGNKVIEVRPLGVNKGAVIPQILAGVDGQIDILAVGDDRTDEDLFGALPPGAHSVHLGDGHSRARWRLETIEEVRRLLRLLADGRAVPQEFAARVI